MTTTALVSKIHDRAGRAGCYVYARAFPGGPRRQYSFTDRGRAERFVTIAGTEGVGAAIEAYDALQRTRSLWGGGTTVAEYAEHYAATRDKAATRRVYAGHAKHVRAFARFDALPIDRVRADDIALFIEWMRKRPSRRGGTLSDSTVYQVWSFLSRVFIRARRERLIVENPCDYVNDPPRNPTSQRSRKVSRVIEDAEFEAIVSRLRRDDAVALYRLIYATGMRYGEATALRWDCITLADGARHADVRVDWTWTTGENDATTSGANIVLGEPKHGRSRVIPTNRDIVTALKSLTPDADGFIFPRARFRGYQDEWEYARDAAHKAGEAPRARIHDLRHSRVTHLLRAGLRPEIVSDIVGHASVAFTLDRYADVTPSDAVAAAFI